MESAPSRAFGTLIQDFSSLPVLQPLSPLPRDLMAKCSPLWSQADLSLPLNICDILDKLCHPLPTWFSFL